MRWSQNPNGVQDLKYLALPVIPPPKVALLPKEQHFAEKIHVYSLPRTTRPNSRTRDLVDLVFLIEEGFPDIEIVRKAVEATFKRRNTHLIPSSLSAPPETWREPYFELADKCGVSRKTLDAAFTLINQFWNDLYS